MAPWGHVCQVQDTATRTFTKTVKTVITATQTLTATHISRDWTSTTTTSTLTWTAETYAWATSTATWTVNRITTITPTITVTASATTVTPCIRGFSSMSIGEGIVYIFTWAGICDLMAALMMGAFIVFVLLGSLFLVWCIFRGESCGDGAVQAHQNPEMTAVEDAAEYEMVEEEPEEQDHQGGEDEDEDDDKDEAEDKNGDEDKDGGNEQEDRRRERDITPGSSEGSSWSHDLAGYSGEKGKW